MDDLIMLVWPAIALFVLALGISRAWEDEKREAVVKAMFEE